MLNLQYFVRSSPLAHFSFVYLLYIQEIEKYLRFEERGMWAGRTGAQDWASADHQPKQIRSLGIRMKLIGDNYDICNDKKP